MSATKAASPESPSPQSASPQSPSPKLAPEPRSAPAATVPALLIGVALLGVAGLCVRELISYHQLVETEPWLANASVWIAQLQWRDWMMWAAPGALAAGLILVAAALTPRRRTHLRLRAETDVWLRPTDLARLSSAVALAEPAVLTATTTVDRKSAAVAVTAAEHGGAAHGEPEAEELRARIAGRVEELLAQLDSPMKVRVSVLPGVSHTPEQRRRVI